MGTMQAHLRAHVADKWVQLPKAIMDCLHILKYLSILTKSTLSNFQIKFGLADHEFPLGIL